ncbi:hypothetical protein F5Y11DRAFT_346540 [Daldinia sp. FL1419]|nr:hypothetical protein F5Y11DRAFT_346540 [Daldinia sp. FL1419]
MSANIYTTPKARGNTPPKAYAYNSQTSWDISPTHRSWGGLTPRSPKPIPWLFSGLPQEEIERQEAEARFQAFLLRMETTPGAPLLPPRPPLTPRKDPLIRRGVVALGEKYDEYSAKAAEWKAWAAEKRHIAKAEYQRAAFFAERKYWLAKTAYDKSPWPRTLRQLRNLLFAVLGLMFVGWLLWLRYLEFREKRSLHRHDGPVYVHVPEFRAWSVSKPRCVEECTCN